MVAMDFTPTNIKKGSTVAKINILGRIKKKKKKKLSKKERNILKKKARKARKGFEYMTDYNKYIKSELWKKRRNDYFSHYGKMCEACGAKNNIQLHHAVYRNKYGCEIDEDLFALCVSCHGEFHDNYGVKGNMLIETKAFVEEKRDLSLSTT